MTDYVPLWVKSNFSFLEGASHAEELVVVGHRVGFADQVVRIRLTSEDV